MATKKITEIKDFNVISVPLTPLRMEIALLQKEGLEVMPLGELLRVIAKVIKNGNV